jgi:hypothetical protein
MHTPLQPTQSDLKIVDSIRLMRRPLDSFYNNLREGDIQQGYLLCYHYRIVSIENCLNKIKNNFWYKKYNLGDLLSTDYPEVVDRTLQEKSLKNKKCPEGIEPDQIDNLLKNINKQLKMMNKT